MARGKQNIKKEPTPKKQCLKCGKLKPASSSNFYKHAENQFKPLDGLHPICCACIDEQINEGDLNSIYKVLEHLDRPFLPDRWKSSIEESKNRKANGSNGWGIWKCYMKNISMKEVIGLTWKDSSFGNVENKTIKENIIKDDNASNVEEVVIHPTTKPDNRNQISDEVIGKWGEGYSSEEYRAFERKYHMLKNNYQEKTAMHTEALLTYVRYRVKEELATAKGDVKDAKEWGALAQKAAQDAKINPSQLSKSDLSDGLDTFGQLVRSVEQAVDIIPILPKFKEKPQDKPDFTLWCYVNYVRDLKGLPLVEYEDIYQFYEQRRKEYESRMDDIGEQDDE